MLTHESYKVVTKQNSGYFTEVGNPLLMALMWHFLSLSSLSLQNFKHALSVFRFMHGDHH